jgi:signal transduction histidine kinase
MIGLIIGNNAKNKLIESQKSRIAKLIHIQKDNESRIDELAFEKMQWSGIVAHDLKGPYNRIFALVQLMQRSSGTLQDQQQEYLSKIHIVIADGFAMIRNLTDNQKLEGKGIDLNDEAIHLTSVLTLLVRNYKVLSEIKKIQLHLKIQPDMTVYADKYCLYRILDNILSNAVKFSAENSNIYIGAQDEGTGIRVAVRDEGPGISEEDQKRLYKKFQKLTAKPTGGETWTGIGLAVARQLADKIGAELVCASKQNEETTFTLRLRKEKSSLSDNYPQN